jgi:hypothetical protein
MFDKTSSICEMVRTGIPLSDIYTELDKCQLLCVSCHKLVTKIEHQSGFIRFKKQITKKFYETEDITKQEELRLQYSEKYREFMSKIYPILKEIIE